MANAGTNKKETLASELVLSGPAWFPLGGQDSPDPLRLVLGQLADLADAEPALVQIVARPATVREQRRLRTLGRRGYLLSIPELAALAHLPAERALPGLLRAGARSISPPPGLPSRGKPLGVTASGAAVVLAVEDARYHLHLLGPTGVGK